MFTLNRLITSAMMLEKPRPNFKVGYIKTFRRLLLDLKKYSDLKIKQFLSFLQGRYVISLKIYNKLCDFLVSIFFIFKKKNTYMQAKYNNNIFLQKSIGMYGYKKKDKLNKYARKKLSTKFVDSFSNFSFLSNTIHLYLKGAKKTYKRSVEPLFEHLEDRLLRKQDKYNNFTKILLRRNRIIKLGKKRGLVYTHTNEQQKYELNAYIELVNSLMYAFSYIRCFYISNSNFGGIRLRRRKEPRFKFY